MGSVGQVWADFGIRNKSKEGISQIQTDLKTASRQINDNMKQAGETAGKSLSDGVKSSSGLLGEQMKLVKAQFKQSMAELGNNASAMDLLRTKADSLNKQLNIQGQLVSNLDERYKKAVQAKGENSREATKLATALANARTAEANIQSEVQKTTKDIKEQSSSLGKLQAEWRQTSEEARQSMGNVFDQAGAAGRNMTVAGVGLAAGLGATVKTAADFEKELSNAKAVSGATTEEMAKLKQAALDMGATTSFSASQAASAMTELMKGGMSADQVLSGGLKSALDLAAAGELNMAEAAEYIIKSMGPFQIAASQSGDIANILAGAANASATDVKQMGFAMSQVGNIAAQMGLDLKDSATTIALFAQKGLEGSDAGTSMKTMLMRLVPSTKEATEAFKQYGFINKEGKNIFFDSNGQLKNMSEVAGILKNSLGGLTAEQQQMAMSTMFGSDAIRAAAILTKEGSEGFNAMAESMSKVTAADVAEEKLNNLHGAVTLLKSSVSTAAITVGDALVPAIKTVAGSLKSAVDGFNKLPGPVKQGIAVTAALAAGLLLVGGPLLMIIGSLPSMAAGFKTIATVAKFVIGGLNPVSLAIGAIIIAGVLLYKNWDTIKAKAQQAWTAIKNTVKGAIDGIKNINVSEIGKNIVQGLWDGIKAMGSWLYDKVASFVKENVVGTVKKFLGIASPSKVMAEFGEYVAQGLAIGMEKESSKVDEQAQKLTSAITNAAQTMVSDLGRATEIAKAKLDLQKESISDNATEMEKLALEMKKLLIEKEDLAAKVEILNIAYDTAKNRLGENNELTREYAHELQLTQIQLQKTEASLNKTSRAIEEQKKKSVEASREQSKELRNLAEEVKKVEQRYRYELAEAVQEYQRKVSETNTRLIEDEKKVTDQYSQELDNRTKSLRDFVGLFDAVSKKDVSGDQLLENLRGQVDSFRDWQANIQELANKGVDEGLIEELRQMGPKAGPEIAALNTLTGTQLTEYVSLWKQKNQDARAEAVNQLQQQRIEMQNKLMEIRQAASEQLEIYRAEWEKKNEEIRKNADEEMNRIQKKFEDTAKAGTTYGVSLMENFIGGIESRFDRLRDALETAASIVDSYMPHSPAKRGPLKRIMEWGPALVGSLADGIKSSLPRLAIAAEGMASVAPIAMGAAISGSGSVVNNSESRVFNINIQPGTPREMVDEIMWELYKRGVRP